MTINRTTDSPAGGPTHDGCARLPLAGIRWRGALRLPTTAARALALVLLLTVLLPPTLSAAGRTEEDAFQAVDGTGNWEYTIDVTDFEPGRYNILVRARDEAGNVSFGGPYNIFVDPEHDRPRVSVSYPLADQAVAEQLFVVGTARDDDAVGRVEVQVNDGSFIRAEGTEYWSATIPMAALGDGPHLLRARAVDVNGTEGEMVEVPINLDTTRPLPIPSSHESGVLISKRTTISGTVEDANGVASLALLAGDRREELRLRGEENAPRFEFEIDPRKMEEGATVWWLASRDRTGSESVTPFLFFVDTSPPELEILYPTEDDRVDGQLRFIGRVVDLVGIESLTWELSTGESGEIALEPGDPFWALAVDLPPDARGNLTASFRVTDLAGNEREERRRYALDGEGDRPTVRLHAPAEGSVVETAWISGHVFDDDRVAAVLYSVDGGEEQRVALEQSESDGFMIDLSTLGPGGHEVRVRAEDVNGIAGEQVRRRFAVATPLPHVELTDVIRGETREPYAPGFTLDANERASLAGRVSAPSGASATVSRLDYRVGTTTGRANVDATGAFTIPLPRGAVAGTVGIDVVATNELGDAVRASGLFIQLPPAAEDGTVPEPAAIVERGLYLGAAPAEVESTDGAGFDAPIILPRGASIQLYVAGGAPSAPSLTPQASFLESSTSGGFVVLRAVADGAAEGVRVSATVGGRSVTSAPFAVRTESAVPAIGRPELTGRRLSALDEISLDVTDNSPLAEVTVAFEAFPPADGATADGSGSSSGGTRAVDATPVSGDDGRADRFRATPALPGVEGPALLRVTATDAAGRTSTRLVPIVIDRAAPDLRVVTPPEGETVNGTVTMFALLSEPGTATAVEIAGDPARPLEIDRLVAHRIVTSDAEPPRVVTRDTAGNETSVTPRYVTDEAADRPLLQLQVPTEGGLVRDEFRLSGVLLDDDAPRSITYRVNDGEPVTVDTDGTFDIDVSMAGLEDGDHSVTVVGTDLGGAESEPVVRSFSISRSEPESALATPTIDSFQRRTVTLTGTATDPNTIREVLVSTNNGASFQSAEGTNAWSYRLDTTLMDDGTHSILVRAVDGAGEQGLLSTTINVDNTPPVLELTEPADGVTVSGRFLVDGRGEDGALAAVRIVAQPLDEQQQAIELVTFDEPGPFAYIVDAATLPPGWYNLRVEAEDRAGNASRIARNLLVEPATVAATPEILIPADGERLSGRFAVTVSAPPASGPVTLLVDEVPFGSLEVDARGVGTFVVEPGDLRSGEIDLVLESRGGGGPLRSAVHTVSLADEGPWLSVDTPGFLSFVRDRPFLTGTAGYLVTDLPAGDDRDATREREAILAAHAVELVEVSLDNGRSFVAARGTESWRYRIETTALPDGRHNLVVRARFANGESVVTRHAIVVDEQAPAVRLLEPSERDTFDDTVRIVGVTTDENPLADVAVVLREGDKARYEVPSFIQGLYVDAHVLGATTFDVGAGLTFFDDNVRLQAQVGVSPPGRFSGLVMGAKLLANVASLPASFFFGPDLGWLSAALAVGANFSYFTMSDDTIAFTDEGLVLAGMVAQLEFPIVRIPDLPVFNTYSFYTEAQLWFISSDVEAGTEFRMAFGLRFNVF